MYPLAATRPHTATTQAISTVLCVDIQDFAACTIGWQADDIRFLLGNYTAEMARVALAHGGTRTTLADGAMSVRFRGHGADAGRQSAVRGVKQAIAMQHRMAELQALWRELGATNSFSIRIGVDTAAGAAENAAWLASQVGPGGIAISAGAHALVHAEVVAEAVNANGASDTSAGIWLVHGERAPPSRRVFQWARLGLRTLADLERLPHGRAC